MVSKVGKMVIFVWEILAGVVSKVVATLQVVDGKQIGGNHSRRCFHGSNRSGGGSSLYDSGAGRGGSGMM